MTILKHELKRGFMPLIIWTSAIAFFLALCVFMFPEMKGEMQGVTDIFASMGSFTAAFGMDRLNFGEFIGFYGVECGNILGIGGAFFAAIIGITALSKEEKEHTADFLYTHPVSRAKIITGKLASIVIRIVFMNIVIFTLVWLSVLAIGESPDWGKLLLFHFAFLLLQLEISAICFGISAFIRSSGLGIGIGIAALMYFLNIIANISDSSKALKYITPFGFADGADIMSSGSLNGAYILIGMLFAAAGIAAAYLKYCKKDIC